MVALGAGIASMRAAMERGDIDEAGRQGMIAGPTVVEAALTAPDRAARLAAVVASQTIEDRAELLEGLAKAASGADRRIAIPAAAAAREIAREIARAERADDLAAADLAQWRDDWGAVARARDRWIEVRILALDTAAALDPTGIGIEIGVALGDPDPAFRRAAVAVVPVPAPPALRAPLAAAVVKDTDPQVALGAAQALCADLVEDAPEPILDALGAPGLTRLRTLVASPAAARATTRDAARCLAADQSPASAAKGRTVKSRSR